MAYEEEDYFVEAQRRETAAFRKFLLEETGIGTQVVTTGWLTDRRGIFYVDALFNYRGDEPIFPCQLWSRWQYEDVEWSHFFPEVEFSERRSDVLSATWAKNAELTEGRMKSWGLGVYPYGWVSILNSRGNGVTHSGLVSEINGIIDHCLEASLSEAQAFGKELLASKTA